MRPLLSKNGCNWKVVIQGDGTPQACRHNAGSAARLHHRDQAINTLALDDRVEILPLGYR